AETAERRALLPAIRSDELEARGVPHQERAAGRRPLRVRRTRCVHLVDLGGRGLSDVALDLPVVRVARQREARAVGAEVDIVEWVRGLEVLVEPRDGARLAVRPLADVALVDVQKLVADPAHLGDRHEVLGLDLSGVDDAEIFITRPAGKVLAGAGPLGSYAEADRRQRAGADVD